MKVTRLIPARAGNTTSGAPIGEGDAAHPRSRGEHGSAVALDHISLGSSPLARGTQAGGCRVSRRVRLIPARAGNTLRLQADSGARSAHPRSRGEHNVPPVTGESTSGSSPLARGTLQEVSDAACAFRLIPARAGNTPVVRDG